MGREAGLIHSAQMRHDHNDCQLGYPSCTHVWFSRGLHPHADMAVAAQGCQAAPYCRRRPEHTILYQIIQQHLETDLSLAREDDWDGERVPAAA